MLNPAIISFLMISVFIIGYIFITIEHITRINKATIAIMMAIICWTLQFLGQHDSHALNLSIFGEHLSNISQVIFFLMGALTIVELINVHRGFDVVAKWISVASKRKLLWLIGLITFFLSSVLDNLTTTIVMISLLSKLITDGEDKLIIGGAIVVAANAGGAWTPIGDVTTTMLWIGGQVSTVKVMRELFLPSMTCLIASLLCLTPLLKGKFPNKNLHFDSVKLEPYGKFIFYLGIACLIFVPVFKIVTGLPPFMGMLLGLSLMWIITDIFHSRFDDRKHLRVPHVITKIDLAGILFFLGILLSIDALSAAGILTQLAGWMDQAIGNVNLIAIFIGLASAIVDNVPLVAAAMGMYGLERFPTDSQFWQMIAYCAGTGGSILLIGSAAGVVFMGLEKVNFFWYLRRIGLSALVGYFAGIGIYLLFQ